MNSLLKQVTDLNDMTWVLLSNNKTPAKYTVETMNCEKYNSPRFTFYSLNRAMDFIVALQYSE